MGFLSARSWFAAAAVVLAGSLSATASEQTGERLDVQTAGHGEPELIFLSEPAAPTTGWDHVVARFEVAYRCHVVAPAADGVSPEEQAGAVVAYAREQGLVRPVLVGRGSGGRVALAVALQAPRLAGRLVLVDGLPAPDSDLGAVRCPTLVLGALAGPSTATRRTVRRLWGGLPGVRFVFSERAGHDLVAEDIDGFTNALRRELVGR